MPLNADPLCGSNLCMRIKICCIKSIDEAILASRAGAHVLGLVSQSLSGAGAIPDTLISEIVARVPESQATCLLTSELDPDDILRRQDATQTDMIQLVGEIPPAAVSELRALLPAVQLLKVVHVEGSESLDLAAAYVRCCDALLLDTAVRSRDGDSLGGTGTPHDWSISRKIVETSPIPVYLAGGLNPGNVEAAISAVRPYGVDVCSGLRRDGRLSPSLVSDFVGKATGAAV
ncbi:MAG: phosphoribosylanthranilate isomerase [Actinobacteria bacterium]|nr:phosphoribosylanthranilate isomerase [Actinomycetota bacterium]